MGITVTCDNSLFKWGTIFPLQGKLSINEQADEASNRTSTLLVGLSCIAKYSPACLKAVVFALIQAIKLNGLEIHVVQKVSGSMELCLFSHGVLARLGLMSKIIIQTSSILFCCSYTFKIVPPFSFVKIGSIACSLTSYCCSLICLGSADLTVMER